jgi:hypothetical protein
MPPFCQLGRPEDLFRCPLEQHSQQLALHRRERELLGNRKPDHQHLLPEKDMLLRMQKTYCCCTHSCAVQPGNLNPTLFPLIALLPPQPAEPALRERVLMTKSLKHALDLLTLRTHGRANFSEAAFSHLGAGLGDLYSSELCKATRAKKLTHEPNPLPAASRAYSRHLLDRLVHRSFERDL